MRKILAAIGAALTAVAFLYTAGNATATPEGSTNVDMGAIVEQCGNTDGQWVVGFRDTNGTAPGGNLRTHKYIDCA